MRRFWRRYRLWLFYVLFVVCAALFGAREGLVTTQGALPGAKLLLLAVYLGFLAFSLYATWHESFFRSITQINGLLWGRQVGIDLYISVFMSLGLIWLVEGTWIAVLFWALPVLVFANLAILPYILLNYAQIIGHFTG